MVTDEIHDRLEENRSEIRKLRNLPEEVEQVEINLDSISEDIDTGWLFVDYVGDRPKMSMYTEPFEFDLTLRLHDTEELQSVKEDLYELVNNLYRPNDEHIVSQDYPTAKLRVSEELSQKDVEYLLSQLA